MKKIAVIGLGIIGGSLCASLTKAGYTVDGVDLDKNVMQIAKEKGYICGFAEEISAYDVVLIAVPPKATVALLENTKFKENALVSDICGIKSFIERAVYAKPRNYRYVGMHPMAGKETSGIQSASSELFNGANVVVTIGKKTDIAAMNELKALIKAMKFGRIVECSAEEHDRKIALTSQLAHIVSNAYVKSPQVSNCKGFTGGSFQDMTRIAGVDEKIWTELYTGNRDFVLEELDGLIAQLSKYREALKNKDDEGLSDALKEGRLIREKIKYKKS